MSARSDIAVDLSDLEFLIVYGLMYIYSYHSNYSYAKQNRFERGSR